MSKAETLQSVFGKDFEMLALQSRTAAKVDEEHIYQEENPVTRAYMGNIMGRVLLRGSGLNGLKNFRAFYDAVTTGKKSGLILMEHYSNMDLPAIVSFLERGLIAKMKDEGEQETDAKQGEKGLEAVGMECPPFGIEWQKDFAKRIVAVAGMKLNEENAFVRAMAEAFTRIVIYPTRSLTKAEAAAQTAEERAMEEKRARKINLAAMHAVSDCKKRRQMVLVFPSGTRYRPGKPETKRGLREVDSYIRLFDIMLLVSINGNCLRINPDDPDNMVADMLVKDKLVLTAHEPIDCKAFRKEVLASLPLDEENPKQRVIDRVMEILDADHAEVEKHRI